MLAVCATPIGNLADVTLRVLDELRAADVILCEDTRTTRVLLDRHGIDARLLRYHEHNEAKRVAELLPRLEAGERFALVSDAGVEVTVLPGPSSVETALVTAGLGADRYRYVGFLPRSERAVRELWSEVARWPDAVVAFESPQRLPRSLASLAAVLPQRPVAVARELTKKFEEVVRGSATEVSARFVDPPRGEVVLVIGPSEVVERSEDESRAAESALAELVEAGVPRRRAADVVSRL